MSMTIIEQRLRAYAPTSPCDELNALKEITEQVVLCALSRARFFEQVALTSTSCLRLIHRHGCFTADVQGMVRAIDKPFVWEPFARALQLEAALHDLAMTITDCPPAVARDCTVGKVLSITHRRGTRRPVITIYLEVDTTLPAYVTFEKHFIHFPYTFAVVTPDLATVFAGTCHRLLTESVSEGRVWFDFAWCSAANVVPNYDYLSHLLNQVGPWKNQMILVLRRWLAGALLHKVNTVDWDHVRGQMQHGLLAHERERVELWGPEFFTAMLGRLGC